MKLSKQILKQIIKEELENFSENNPEPALDMKTKRSRADALGSARADAAAQGGAGITAEERGLIKQLNDLLTKAAQNTNLASGTIYQRMKLFADALQKRDQDTGGKE